MLRPGDLLFYQVTPRSLWGSKIIACLEIVFGELGKLKSDGRLYTHVAMIDFNTKEKVEMAIPVSRKIEIDFTKPMVVGEVHLTQESREKALVWARERIGEKYSFLDWIKAKLGDNNANKYCSGWINRAFWEGAGIYLTHVKDTLLSPDEMAQSPLIALRELSKEDVG